MSDTFFTNQCAVCQLTENLSRCTGCLLIFYCGKEHQKSHRKEHKAFCKAISELMKEEGVSHIYEKSLGADSKKWMEDTERAVLKVKEKLKRDLTPIEEEMLYFPRVCLICHDTRKENLINCPKCPAVTFCIKHPSSPMHDEECASVQELQQLMILDELQLKLPLTLEEILKFVEKSFEEFDTPLSSMEEFLNYFYKDDIEEIKISISTLFTLPLTIIDTLKKLEMPPKSDLELHVYLKEFIPGFLTSWEIILHWMPELIDLKVVFFGFKLRQKMQMSLCDKCNLRGKGFEIETTVLEYIDFMKEAGYSKPDLVGFFNINALTEGNQIIRTTWHEEMLPAWSKLSVPLLLTTNTEKLKNIIVKDLKSSRRKIYFIGQNPFTSLGTYKKPGSKKDLQVNSIMIISKLENSKAAIFRSRAELNEELESKVFYANVCHVCRSSNNSIVCKYCKIISYCGEEHKNEHWNNHKSICKIIVNLTKERKAKNLFGGLKTTNQEDWLIKKLDLLTQAMSKKWNLLGYEKQIFLFPRACFVCHESDLDLLKTCGCGTSLCIQHEEDPNHKKICKQLTLAFRITMLGQQPLVKASAKESLLHVNKQLPISMESFIDMYLNFQDSDSKTDIPNFQKVQISNLLTKPLTCLYVLKKLKIEKKCLLVVHLIGSTDFDLAIQSVWSIVQFWLNREADCLFKFIFISPELTNRASAYNFANTIKLPLQVTGSKLCIKSEACNVRYEEYMRNQNYYKPDIIIGCNLNIYESNYGIGAGDWTNTFKAIEKLMVPFALTGGTEERVRKNHEILCNILGKNLDILCFERNPFAGLNPERDFETEKVKYSNHYLIIYENFKMGSSLSEERNLSHLVTEHDL